MKTADQLVMGASTVRARSVVVSAMAIVGLGVIGLAAPVAAQDWVYTQESTPDELATELTIWRAASATPDGSGVVFYGGTDPDAPVGSPAEANMWRFGGTWNAICGTSVPGADQACAPGPRSAHAMAPASTGVLLYGGSAVSASGGGAFGSLEDDTWLWDGTTWSQVCDGCPPGDRGSPALATNSDRSEVIMFGGFTGSFPDGDKSPVSALTNESK